MNCIYNYNNECRLASSIARTAVPTSEAACQACKALDKPMRLNRVVYSLAYKATNDPKFLESFKASKVTTPFNHPGYCLKQILKECGVPPTHDCGCEDYAALMDSWGTEGCILRREDISHYLNNQPHTVLTMLKIASHGYFTTLQLVDEAIKRSKNQLPLYHPQ